MPGFVALKDCSGQERYNSLIPNYLISSAIIIVGFDVTDLKSWECCKTWIETARDQEPRCHVVVAVGNKIDLVDERKISREEAEDELAAMDPPVPYFETSALTGEGVNELYEGVVKLWLETPDSQITNSNVSEENVPKKRRRSRNDCIVC